MRLPASLRARGPIFTNSVNLVNILAESDNDIYLMGWKDPSQRQGHRRRMDIGVLASLHADLAFSESDGFKNAAGPTSMSYEEMNLSDSASSAPASDVCRGRQPDKILSEDRFSYARWEEVTGIVTAGKFTDRVREISEGQDGSALRRSLRLTVQYPT